jgi:hypothetical protein
MDEIGTAGSQCLKNASQLEEQINRLGDSIETAGSLKVSLEGALSCILRNEPPFITKKTKSFCMVHAELFLPATEDKAKEVVSLVPLATKLADFNFKMILLNQRLESILNRIEL